MSRPAAYDPAADADRARSPLLRMVIAALALVGVFISVYLLLHRLGIVGTLVCGTGGCETVQTSKYATFVGIPVPALGVVGYGLIFLLALVGSSPGRVDDPWVGTALLVLAALALVFTAYLNALEAFVIHAWCRWCLGSAAIVALIFLLALADFRGWRQGNE